MVSEVFVQRLSSSSASLERGPASTESLWLGRQRVCLDVTETLGMWLCDKDKEGSSPVQMSATFGLGAGYSVPSFRSRPQFASEQASGSLGGALRNDMPMKRNISLPFL
jgi:hypothetical protein